MKIFRQFLLVAAAVGFVGYSAPQAFSRDQICSSMTATACAKATGATRTQCCKCFPEAAACATNPVAQDKCSRYTAAGCLKDIGGGADKAVKDGCCNCFNYKSPSFTAAGCMKIKSLESKNLCLLCVQGHY